MVTEIIRANISENERKAILHEVQVIAGEIVKDLKKQSTDNKLHMKGEKNE